jgi:hypothetical protein
MAMGEIIFMLTALLPEKIELAIPRSTFVHPSSKTALIAKLELQTILDSEIPFSGHVCSVENKKDRQIFVADGIEIALIKMNGRLIKLKKINKNPTIERYSVKDISIDVNYGQGKRGGSETIRFDNVKFRVVSKGHKLNIIAHGGCSS